MAFRPCFSTGLALSSRALIGRGYLSWRLFALTYINYCHLFK